MTKEEKDRLGGLLNDKGWDLHMGLTSGKPDHEAAIPWYEKAAALGCATAMVNLGNIYEDHEDYSEAYYWYLEAALAGDLTGMFNVGNMYYWGWYVSQDFRKGQQDSGQGELDKSDDRDLSGGSVREVCFMNGINSIIDLKKTDPTEEQIAIFCLLIRSLQDLPYEFVIFNFRRDDGTEKGLIFYQMCRDGKDMHIEVRIDEPFFTVYANTVKDEEAIALLREMIDTREAPDVSDWEDITAKVRRGE